MAYYRNQPIPNSFEMKQAGTVLFYLAACVILSCQAVRLGEVCTDDAECRVWNAYCSSPHPFDYYRTCVCKHDYIEFNSTCIPVRHRIGDTCRTHQQCQIRWSSCEFGNTRRTCQCDQGYAPSRDRTRCKFVPDYNHPMVLMSKVRIRSVDMSEERVKLGDFCQHSGECPRNTLCNRNACTCSNGYEPNVDNTACVPAKVGLDESCASGEICAIEHASCQEGKCLCDKGFKASDFNFKCLPIKAGLNETCANNDDCMSRNAHCLSNKCSCKAGFADINNHCLPVQYQIGGVCKYNKQCGVKESHCETDGDQKHTCRCNPKFVQNVMGTKCLPRANMTESCNTNKDCKTEHSFCVSHTCICDSGYVPYGGKCVPMQYHINGTCQTDNQCPEFSYCQMNHNKTGTCLCYSGFRPGNYNTTCLHQKGKLHEWCKFNEDCETKNAACIFNRCNCHPNFVELFNGCQQKSNIGGSCVTSEQCWPRHSHCAMSDNGTGICVCDKDYAASATKTMCKPTHSFFAHNNGTNHFNVWNSTIGGEH